MAYRSLNHFVQKLEDNGELIRVQKFVSPVLEIPEICDRFSKSEKGGKALFFEQTGTDFPVLINSMGSDNRMALALSVKSIEEIESKLDQLFAELKEPRKSFFEKLAVLPSLAKISRFFPSRHKGKAECQEIVHNDPDLDILPILKTWPHDGGKFITLPLVFTEDPESGERNVGMYRMQVFNKNTTGMHWHRHKTGANHYEKYKKLGKRMPVAVALGGDPAISYSATAPLPENIDELLLAGFLRNKSVAMVKCLTQDILVPAESEIILEGYVDPAEDKVIEGPFGDHTGFYSLEDYYPLFHITCITHRKNAVYPATLVGIPPQEDAWIAKVTERIFLKPIQLAIAPEITDMYIPEFGVAHNLTIVSINKTYPGQAKKIMNALWGAGQMMFNKVLIVCDREIDIHNLNEVFGKLIQSDLSSCFILSEGPLDVLDHSANMTGYGSKLGIDLTDAFEEEKITAKNILGDKLTENRISLSQIPGIVQSRNIYSDNKKRIMLLAVSKDKKFRINTLFSKLQELTDLKSQNLFLVVDEFINIHSFREFLWYFLNNMEPQRDILRIPSNSNEAVLLIDGTSKSMENDKFRRDWPNPVVMDKKTIETIDNKWNELNLGPFIQSPSLHYQKLVQKPGARAFKNSSSQ